MLKYLSIVTLFILMSFNSQSQTLVTAMSLQDEEFLGEEFCFSYNLKNSGDPGYNPYVRVLIPPGITFNDATYNGSPTNSSVAGVFTASPLKDPMLNTGTVADSVTGPAGYTLVIVDVTVGSLVENGPVLNFEICATIDAGATVGIPLDVTTQAVYELGDTPLGTNGPIFGTEITQQITPILYRVVKSGPGEINPGGGGALCHIYTYNINIDIAAAGTLNGTFDITDKLDADIAYGGNLNYPAGCAITSEPIVGSLGGTYPPEQLHL